jgi:hypothetical protein
MKWGGLYHHLSFQREISVLICLVLIYRFENFSHKCLGFSYAPFSKWTLSLYGDKTFIKFIFPRYYHAFLLNNSLS